MGGKFKFRIRMETNVWWSAGGGSLIKKLHGNHCMVERRGGSLNKEVKWRPLFGGARGGGKFNKKASWRPCMVDRRGPKVLNKEVVMLRYMWSWDRCVYYVCMWSLRVHVIQICVRRWSLRVHVIQICVRRWSLRVHVIQIRVRRWSLRVHVIQICVRRWS